MARSGMSGETHNRSPSCKPIGRHYLGQDSGRCNDSPEGRNETVGYFGPKHVAIIREALTSLSDGRSPPGLSSWNSRNQFSHRERDVCNPLRRVFPLCAVSCLNAVRVRPSRPDRARQDDYGTHGSDHLLYACPRHAQAVRTASLDSESGNQDGRRSKRDLTSSGQTEPAVPELSAFGWEL